jgi:NADPH:quinone reductase-like Zn-dependent oxidoreductase
MRALVHSRYGEPDALRVEDVPEPALGRGRVLIDVRAASVNAADVFMMRGVPRLVRPGNGFRAPKRTKMGLDVAGVVAAVGPGVTRWSVGDAVFGQGTATFAELATAAEDALTALPEGVTFEHAATLPVAGTTALRALDVANVTAGQRVVVTGAAGGVGQFAAQLAVLRGAEVIAVCSGRNVERVRSLGIETVIDYETQSPLDTDQPYDVVLDNAGGVAIRDWRTVVRKGGTILPNAGVQGADGGAMMRLAKTQWHRMVAPQRVRSFYASALTAPLEELGAHVAGGRITPLVDTMFTLDHVADAIARVGTHHARGKVIVTMGSRP